MGTRGCVWLLAGADAEGFHFAVEVGAFEAEGLGGAGDVAHAAVEFFEDVVALVGFASLQEGGELFATVGATVGGGAAVGALDEHGEVLGFDALDFGIEDEDALHDVAELADVAGPVVGLEGGEGGVGDFYVGAAVLLAELGEEFAGEKRDVFFAVAEGRDEERDDVEAIEEVFAEVAAGDLFFEIFVGGGDDAGVDVDGGGGTDGVEALFVEGAEDFGLRLEAHVADFVEEEGAAVGSLEGAAFLGGLVGAAGARSVAIAEEFGFDVVLGDGGAVEFDEDAVAAEGLGVDGAGDEFFAGAGFAED